MFEIFDIMFEVSALSILVAAISVVIGVIFALLELRNLVRTRQTDLLVGLYSTMSSRDSLEAWEKVREEEFKDYTDAIKKVGGVGLNQVILLFEEVGILLNRRLVNVNLVEDLFPVKFAWEKLKLW
jgi:hypothetical protein